jgi:type IV secretory pathway VirD2 relaxase
MIRSIMKHSYIRAGGGHARAAAHISYIADRDGRDRGVDGREFFDGDRDGINARDVKHTLDEFADERGVLVHKMIMSPGVTGVDVKQYTREIMAGIEEKKQQELEWRAVVHENTAHPHAHVLIFGIDKNGHLVRFDMDDHKSIRRLGDDYLDREHRLDRYLDREMSTILRSEEYQRTGDREFRSLFGPTQDERDREREKERDPERDRREFSQFDEDLRQSLQERSRDLYPVRGGQRRLEDAGRLSEAHGDYATAMARQRLNELALDNPESADSIRAELTYLNELAAENRQEPTIQVLMGIGADVDRGHAEPFGEQYSDGIIKAETGTDGTNSLGEDFSEPALNFDDSQYCLPSSEPEPTNGHLFDDIAAQFDDTPIDPQASEAEPDRSESVNDHTTQMLDPPVTAEAIESDYNYTQDLADQSICSDLIGASPEPSDRERELDQEFEQGGG